MLFLHPLQHTCPQPHLLAPYNLIRRCLFLFSPLCILLFLAYRPRPAPSGRCYHLPRRVSCVARAGTRRRSGAPTGAESCGVCGTVALAAPRIPDNVSDRLCCPLHAELNDATTPAKDITALAGALRRSHHQRCGLRLWTVSDRVIARVCSDEFRCLSVTAASEQVPSINADRGNKGGLACG